MADDKVVVLDSNAFRNLYPDNMGHQFTNSLSADGIDNFKEDLEMAVIQICLHGVQIINKCNHAIYCSLIKDYQVGDGNRRLLKLFYINRKDDDCQVFYEPILYYPLERGIHKSIQIDIKPLSPQFKGGTREKLLDPPVTFERCYLVLHIRKRKIGKEARNLFLPSA